MLQECIQELESVASTKEKEEKRLKELPQNNVQNKKKGPNIYFTATLVVTDAMRENKNGALVDLQRHFFLHFYIKAHISKSYSFYIVRDRLLSRAFSQLKCKQSTTIDSNLNLFPCILNKNKVRN